MMRIAKGPIFEPTKPLAEVAAKADAAHAADPIYTEGAFYRREYSKVKRRLKANDMLSVDEAAKRLHLDPADYLQEAAAGRALLIEFEGMQVVPAWQISTDPFVTQLKLDIAREFAREEENYSQFKFIDYINFMTQTTADITPALYGGKAAPLDLQSLFNREGLQDFECELSVEATINQIADRCTGAGKAAFLKLLVDEIGLKMLVCVGQGENECFLSQGFRDKYDARKPKGTFRPHLGQP